MFEVKSNIDKDMNSAGHKIALHNESIYAKFTVNTTPNQSKVSIKTSFKDSTKIAYRKLFEATYNLAEGVLPYNKFGVLVKCLQY